MAERNDPKTGRMHRGPGNFQRQRILELVRGHDGALDAQELAAGMGLHVTTVRFHLDALCDQGAVQRTRIGRAGVGRPRIGYLAVRDRMDYRSLAEILALELGATADQRRRRAEAAGRRWAERIDIDSVRETAAGQDGSDTVTSRDLTDRSAAIVSVFARMGFAPELTVAATRNARTGQTIRLNSCPVRDLARAHPEVGCALHRGLLQGLLAKPAAGDDPTAEQPRRTSEAELEPFVEPDLCLARVIVHD
ncbi:helix-turn-helix transcriptional regulator [Mycobacterium sp. THU-M104]|uniref:helix-turn-helix transcriptional regulator n=1 Tax=Mycobacterium sp. THU-M104 TaxID=3410515 RepID=UPI003B996C9A